MIDLLQLVLGLALLIGGGHLLVSNASALASNLGVSKLAIGLTIVAFGTSAPELSVNTMAAIRGSGDIAFGNVMGSNLANIGLVVGLAAVMRTMTIQNIVITREIPMMLLASVAALVMGADWIRGEATSQYDRSEAIILFLFFTVFLYYTVGDTIEQSLNDPNVEQLEQPRTHEITSIARTAGLIAAGLVILTIGGHLTVEGTVGLAKQIGVSDAIIGLTIVALGTSLPELSTSVIAAYRHENDLAIGNVVGSNIFNLLFVLATTALIRPVPIPPGGLVDLCAVLVFSAFLWLICSPYGSQRITHRKGWLLVGAYLLYMAVRTTTFAPFV
jgi:cation:H+ antiporter